MKLLTLTFRKHPILEGLHLIFTDKQGNPFDTIILAGENGCGKTVILETIHKFFSLRIEDEAKNELIAIQAKLSNEEMNILNNSIAISAGKCVANRTFDVLYDKNIKNEMHIKCTFGRSDTTTFDIYPSNRNTVLNSLFKSIYSEAIINFQVGNIQSITASNVDTGERIRKSDNTIGTTVAQLLIDIHHQDCNDLSVWVENNPETAPPKTVKNVRVRRFKDAFHSMFPNKKLDEIKPINNQHKIFFTEHNRKCDINQLSSGEKQIVFRGGFILRDQGSLKDGVVLVDEPEISMHPEWQKHVLSFYKRLVTDEHEVQQCQLFLATHSPFLIHSAAAEKVIVLKKDQNTGKIYSSKQPEYQRGGPEILVKEAFNLAPVMQLNQKSFILLVEGESDRIVLENAWEKLHPSQACWFNIVEAFADGHIKQLLERNELYRRYSERTFIGLWDFDDAFNQWNGLGKNWSVKEDDDSKGLVKKHKNDRGYGLLLPIPTHRVGWASKSMGKDSTLSIEFYFEDKDIPLENKEEKSLSQGKNIVVFVDSKKSGFAKTVSNFTKEKFTHFESLFTQLNRIKTGDLT